MSPYISVNLFKCSRLFLALESMHSMKITYSCSPLVSILDESFRSACRLSWVSLALILSSMI